MNTTPTPSDPIIPDEVLGEDDSSLDRELRPEPVRDAGFHTAEGLAATAVAVAVLLVLKGGLSTFATSVVSRLNELIG
jgi:hypothetical protein